jgi:hypothetical protein
MEISGSPHSVQEVKQGPQDKERIGTVEACLTLVESPLKKMTMATCTSVLAIANQRIKVGELSGFVETASREAKKRIRKEKTPPKKNANFELKEGKLNAILSPATGVKRHLSEAASSLNPVKNKGRTEGNNDPPPNQEPP